MDEVVAQYRSSLTRIIDGIVRDRWAAEDVCQEVFMRLFTHAETLRDAANLSAWLRRVARNMALTYLRDRRNSYAARRGGPEATPTPPELLEEDERLRRVLAAAERLDEPFRTTFRVCAIEGNDYSRTAAILGCNKTTVNTRMFRAWRRLRVMVRE